MLLAYRRGLLEPDYKYGLQSQIRERLVLRMMAAEQDAAALDSILTKKNIVLAPHIDPAKIGGYLRESAGSWTHIVDLTEYNLRADKHVVSKEDRDISRAFIELQKKGIIEEFRKAAEKAIQEHLAREAENDVI